MEWGDGVVLAKNDEPITESGEPGLTTYRIPDDENAVGERLVEGTVVSLHGTFLPD